MCDMKELTPSDFTILVKNIPRRDGANYKEEIKKFFENEFIKKNQK